MIGKRNRARSQHGHFKPTQLMCSLIGGMLAFQPYSAAALPMPAGEIEIARCIGSVANGRIWLERTLWGLRDQEGGWIGAEVSNSNGTHDLGPLQVNSWWVGRIASLLDQRPEVIRGWLANDACFNVRAASWIFLSGLATSRDYWQAIGTYHSPTRWRQLRYAHSVAARMKRRFGEQVFDTSVAKQVEAKFPAHRMSSPFPKVP